jgi:hypothetical protein
MQELDYEGAKQQAYPGDGPLVFGLSEDEAAAIDALQGKRLQQTGVEVRKLGIEIKDLGKESEEMGRTLQAAFSAIGSAITTAVDAVVSGKSSFADAMQNMTASVLTQLGAQATTRAMFELASGIASAASYDYAAASQHFAAAALFGVIGVAATAGGDALRTESGGGSRAGSGTAGGESSLGRVRESSATSRGEPITYNLTQYIQGSVIREGEQGRYISHALQSAQQSGMARPNSVSRADSNVERRVA